VVPFGLCRVGEGAESERLVPFSLPFGFAFRALWDLAVSEEEEEGEDVLDIGC